MSNKNTAPRVSSMGAAVYPAGLHPRDLRKEPQVADNHLHEAYIGWLQAQDEVTQEVAHADVARGFAMFQAYIAGQDPVRFATQAESVPVATPMPEPEAPAEDAPAKPARQNRAKTAPKSGVVDTNS